MKPLDRHVARLHTCSRMFDGRHIARKRNLIEKQVLGRREFDVRDLPALHDALLFIAAFPDDAKLRTLAERGLRRVRTTVSELARTAPRQYQRLAGTGVACSCIEQTFSLDMMRTLIEQFADDVELIWDDESLGEVFDHLLPLLVAPAEYDSIISSSNSTREWIAAARGNQSEAAWLIARFDRLLKHQCIDRPLLDLLLDQVSLYVRWHLNDPAASITSIRFPERRLFFHAPRPPGQSTASTPRDNRRRFTETVFLIRRRSQTVDKDRPEHPCSAQPRDRSRHLRQSARSAALQHRARH